MTSHRNPAFATTLANGLAVLGCFRSGDPLLSNKDLSERTGLSKATISRLTYTLVLKGLLLYDTGLRRYRLAAGVLSLSYPLLADIRLRQIARPYMRALATRTGGTVSLGLYDRLHMIYVETSRGHDLAAFRPDIGARLPVLASAMGRAWLAHASPDQRMQVLTAVQQTDPAQRQRYAPALQTALNDWETRGYCLSEGDWLPDVHAVAAVIRHTDPSSETLVLNCGVTVARLNGRHIRDQVAQHLRDTVDLIEQHLLQEAAHAN